MTLEAFKEAVKKDGWLIIRNGGYIYFKRRDTTKPNNQGAIYSCHTKKPEEAIKLIQSWIIKGYPATKKEKLQDSFFIDYLYSFWNCDSLYFRSAEYEGRHITKGYILQNQLFIKTFLEKFFKNVRLSEINEKILNDFFNWLFSYVSPKTGRPLARATIARVKACLLQPLKYGRQKGIIKQVIDFMIVCPNIGRKATRNRGILTPEETAILLTHKWEDKKAFIAFCIAVYCGLRIGEIRALKIGNIKKGFLIVSQSFNDYDGLKCTKNGKIRLVPCSDDLMILLSDYVLSLPPEEQKENCFLLTDDLHKGQPLYKNYCIKKFYKALEQCGIKRNRENQLTGEKEYICFHSLRHQTATRWVESGLDLRLIAQAMGHTIDMLEHYSNHFNKNDMAILRQGLERSNTLGAISQNIKLID